MSDPHDVQGTAALAICESLLLALNDNKVLPESEIIAILTDAAVAHEQAFDGEEATARHTSAAKLIRAIIDSGNSVRRL